MQATVQIEHFCGDNEAICMCYGFLNSIRSEFHLKFGDHAIGEAKFTIFLVT